MREATDRLNDPEPFKSNSWHPDALELWADRLGAEDRAKAEQAAMVEEMAREMCEARFPKATDTTNHAYLADYRVAARRLIEQGWRKGGSDE